MDEFASETDKLVARLRLPKVTVSTLSYCEPTPQAIKQFLEELPHTNPAELCNRLYKVLPELAGLQAPPGKKMALLDIARPEVINAVQRLTKNLAISASTAKLISLSIAMLRYLAEGYKAVLVASLQSSAAPPNLAVNASYMGINVLSQILLECWESYIPPPANVWREIHSIFAIARLKGLEKAPVNTRQLVAGVTPTIRSAYVTPLLLACADPGRYTPQDIRSIEAFLNINGHLVDFAKSNLEGIFVIDAQGDTGPQYSFKIDGTTNRHFRLRTFRLVRHIEEKLSTGTLSGLSERLARDLCKYWSNEIKRQDDPTPDDTPVTIIFGLGHIHRHLTQTKNLDSYLRSLAPLNPKDHLTLEAMEEAPSGDQGRFLNKQSHYNFNFRDKPIEFKKDEESFQKDLRLYEGTRVNTSQRGARIEFNAPSETLTAGELMLFCPGTDNKWQLGLVRWTKITKTFNRLVGIQLFPGSIAPCAVSQLTATSQGSEQYYPALMLTDGEDRKLLVPTLGFRPYSSAKLHEPGGKHSIRLLEATDSTYHIAVFKLERTSGK